MKKVTIKDVAKKAGVSISIVSFALNNVEGRVSEKVKQKVVTCANELGYVPNNFARQMRRKKSNTIALVYPKSHFEERNSGTVELVALVCKYASLKGLDVMIKLFDEDNQQDFENECLELFQSQKIDGMIIYSNIVNDTFLNNFKNRNVNFVHITEKKPLDEINSIYLDNYNMTYNGVKFINSKGYYEIYYLYAKTGVIHNRVSGYQAAINDLKIQGEVIYYPNPYRQKEDIWNAIKDIVINKKNKIAIFCWNDIDAINVLELLAIHKINVPEDVGVMGVDDLIIGEHISPKLTTFKQPFDEIARLSIETLQNSETPKSVELNAVIIERESI